MDDVEIKKAIVAKRWRVWYRDSSFSINAWHVQRRTWYGRWKTIGSFWSEREALKVKEVLKQEDLLTFRGDLSELQ